MKIANELERQRHVEGNIVISGLPKSDDLNPESVLINLCSALAVDESLIPKAKKANLKLVSVENKSQSHTLLRVSNLHDDLREKLMAHYRNDKRQKKYLTAGDLVENGGNKPIYLNNELTGYFQMLFKKARDLRRMKVLKYVWEVEGKIYYKVEDGDKTVRIKHLNDLDKFYE
ncbi:hypothetical protein DMENIID0001_147650 [Sergentomyia squamirostris]